MCEKYKCAIDDRLCFTSAATQYSAEDEENRDKSKEAELEAKSDTITLDGHQEEMTDHEDNGVCQDERKDEESDRLEEKKSNSQEIEENDNGHHETTQLREKEEKEAEEEEEETDGQQQQEAIFFQRDAKGPELREMFECLNSLTWNRVGVKFDNYMSHVNIICKKHFFTKFSFSDSSTLSPGTGVLQHLVDHFTLTPHL